MRRGKGMNKPKFKIGDRIRLKNDAVGYDVCNTELKKGDIVTIEVFRESYDGEMIYGFKEDDKEETDAIWCEVENNFELVIDIDERE
jgi:hypothetical protein